MVSRGIFLWIMCLASRIMPAIQYGPDGGSLTCSGLCHVDFIDGKFVDVHEGVITSWDEGICNSQCNYPGCNDIPCDWSRYMGTMGALMPLSCNTTGFYPAYCSGKCYWVASVWPTSSNSDYPRPSGINYCPEPPCPVGTYSSTGTGGGDKYSCSPCAAGSTTPQPGSTSCSIRFESDPCPHGTYISTNGTCITCAPGTFSPVNNTVECLQCDLGKYSTVAGAMSIDTCQSCPPGKFGAQRGQTTCLSCDYDNWIIRNFLQDIKPKHASYTSNCNWVCNAGFHQESNFSILNGTLHDTWRGPWGSRCNDPYLTVDSCEWMGWAEENMIFETVSSVAYKGNMSSVFDSCCQCARIGLQHGKITRSFCNTTSIERRSCVRDAGKPKRDLEKLTNANLSACSLDESWFVSKFELGQGDFKNRFRTGGLGKIMVPDQFEVWVCDRFDACVPSGKVDMMCYTFNEQSHNFVPLDLNSEVVFVKPQNVPV